MATKMNHARHAHRGRSCEQAFVSRAQRDAARFTPARAANDGHSLDPATVARLAAAMGLTVVR